jgi:DUF1707 SHOCT-like domain
MTSPSLSGSNRGSNEISELLADTGYTAQYEHTTVASADGPQDVTEQFELVLTADQSGRRVLTPMLTTRLTAVQGDNVDRCVPSASVMLGQAGPLPHRCSPAPSPHHLTAAAIRRRIRDFAAIGPLRPAAGAAHGARPVTVGDPNVGRPPVPRNAQVELMHSVPINAGSRTTQPTTAISPRAGRHRERGGHLWADRDRHRYEPNVLVSAPLPRLPDSRYARGKEAQMCWSSYRHHRFEDRDDEGRRFEGRPSNDPVGAAGNLRVSDAERDRVVELLTRHTAEGRLTFDEFEARVEETLSARTGTELRLVLRELPALEADRRPVSRVPPGPMPRLPVVVIAFVVVWLAVGHFPVWPFVIVAVLWFRASAGRRRRAPLHHARVNRTDADDMTFV